MAMPHYNDTQNHCQFIYLKKTQENVLFDESGWIKGWIKFT